GLATDHLGVDEGAALLAIEPPPSIIADPAHGRGKHRRAGLKRPNAQGRNQQGGSTHEKTSSARESGGGGGGKSRGVNVGQASLPAKSHPPPSSKFASKVGRASLPAKSKLTFRTSQARRLRYAPTNVMGVVGG